MSETLAQWLMKKYVGWIQEMGSVQTQGAFAKHLGLSRVVLSRYMNGQNKTMEYPNALKVAQALYDFEIFDILGYERPDTEELLSSFSPEIRSLILDALDEARAELSSKGITTGGEEAAKIISTAFSKRGVNFKVN